MDSSTGLFKRCGCRDPRTRRALGTRCPQLGEDGHGSWYFRLEVPRNLKGRRQLRRGGFATCDAARKAHDHLAAPASMDPSAALVTVEQWLTLWIDTRTGPERSTLRGYRYHVRHYLIPHLGHILLRELDWATVQGMFTTLIRTGGVSGKPLTSGSLHRLHATLRAGLNVALRRGLIVTNPARWGELPGCRRPHAQVWTEPLVDRWRKTGWRPEVAVWTVEQTAEFITYLEGHQHYLLFHLIILLGLRRGEAAGLHWSDIDLTNRLLIVRRQVRQYGGRIYIKKPKSDASNRAIALDDNTVALLRQYRHQHGDLHSGTPTGFVFTNPYGGPLSPNYLTNLFRTLNDDAGLPPVRLHDLRHGAGSLSLAAGNDLKTVQDMLGHSSIVLTADTYVSVLPSLARKAAEATAQLILTTATSIGRRLRRRPGPGTPRTDAGQPPYPQAHTDA